MANKQKVRNFIKEHVPEIMVLGSMAVGVIAGATWMGVRLSDPMPHKVIVKSDSKEFIDALRMYMGWNGGKRFESSHVGFGLTDTEVRDFIDGRLGEKSSEYLYGVMIEKIKK